MIRLKITELTKEGNEFIRVASLKRERNRLFEALEGFEVLTLSRVIAALQADLIEVELRADSLREANTLLLIVYCTKPVRPLVPHLYERN